MMSDCDLKDQFKAIKNPCNKSNETYENITNVDNLFMYQSTNHASTFRKKLFKKMCFKAQTCINAPARPDLAVLKDKDDIESSEASIDKSC
jgi:hypothetical protein